MTDFVVLNGMDTREIGVFCTSLPPIQIAQERVNKIPVLARSGYLHISEDSFESIIKTVGFFYQGDNPAMVAEFFRNAKTIIFSNEPDRLYLCELSGSSELENTIFDWHEFKINFECNPEKRESNPQNIAGISGMTLFNPGNRKAYPTFKISGAGTIVLTVGDQVVTLTNVSGTTVVDGDLKECYRSTGASRNNFMFGTWPVIQPSETVSISWTGSITAVEISPNWRYV